MLQYEIEEIHDGEYIKVLKYSYDEESDQPLVFLIPGKYFYNLVQML